VRQVPVHYTVGIVGGSGFVGQHLTERFSSTYDVKVLDVRQPPSRGRTGARFCPCDVRRCSDVEKGLADVDLVIHAAIVQIPLINEQPKLGYEVNIVGTQNVCQAVVSNERIKGLILAGSWHTIGERELRGLIDEEFGFRPSKVEERARLYAFSKIGQECIVNFYGALSGKSFGILRTGTVLGEGMPNETAASKFIESGLRGEPITPYSHTMFRPMLFVDIRDVCSAYEKLVAEMLTTRFTEGARREVSTINLYYPTPVTIIELAEIVRRATSEHSPRGHSSRLKMVDTGQKPLFNKNDKSKFRVDITKAAKLLGMKRFRSPQDSIEEFVRNKKKNLNTSD
jgi:nucleoside-diphosphate-sugar epimerase